MVNNAQDKLFVVIPVLNGWGYTQRCLAALDQSRYRHIQVIIVDHGSTDETKTALPRDYPAVTHILADSALWWAGAVNVGLRAALQAGARQIMLLNNDCCVAPDTIDILMRAARQRPDAVIAPVQRDQASGEVMSLSPDSLLWAGFAGRRGGVVISEEMRKQQIIPVKLIAGGRGVVIPVSVIEKVGMLDEVNLPHYYADHDFYFRCRRAGVPLYVAVEADVLVDNSKTSMAEKPGQLSFPEFIASLRDRRSHRNLAAVGALFRKHYPLRHLYFVGVWLHLMRYLIRYSMARSRYLLSGGKQ